MFDSAHSTEVLFTCSWCGATAAAFTSRGEARNHCPACLGSMHTIERLTDEPSSCLGKMVVISIAARRDRGWSVIHRCTRCDSLHAAPIDESDNQLRLVQAAVGPISNPPFPLEAFATA